MNWKLLVLLFFGLWIRLILIPNPGFEADLAFWKSWSLAASDLGIVQMTETTNNNYPPGFFYLLWTMGKVYRLIGDPHDFYHYWASTNVKFLAVAKSIPILADVAVTIVIYYLLVFLESQRPQKTSSIRDKNHNLPLIGAAMYFLSPVSILDGAWWGQVDSLGTLFLIVSLYLLFKNRPAAAFGLLVFGFLVKLQNMIYLPIILTFIWRRYGWQALANSLFAGFLAWIVATSPFLLTKKMSTVFYLLGVNADWFPWLSLHAYNIWWLVAGGNGMGLSDKFLLLGQLSPKQIGLVIFAAAYLAVILTILVKPKRSILTACLFLTVFAFFMLLTQSHERYIFPAFVLLPLLLPNFLAQTKHHTARKIGYLVFFFLLTVTTSFDLYRTLLIFYPANGILPALPLVGAKIIGPTMVVSIVNVFLFLITIIYTTAMAGFWILPLCVLFAGMGLLFLDRNYLGQGRVPLTAIKSTDWYQQYGQPAQNMPVGSSSDPMTWKHLSNNYFFYRQGIGTHAKSEISYSLQGKFSRLSTDFGVDTEAGTHASVVFKIVGDDKLLFASKTLGRFDLPGHADVNLTGIDKLKLIVEDAGDGNIDDHADWLHPILYR